MVEQEQTIVFPEIPIHPGRRTYECPPVGESLTIDFTSIPLEHWVVALGSFTRDEVYYTRSHGYKIPPGVLLRYDIPAPTKYNNNIVQAQLHYDSAAKTWEIVNHSRFGTGVLRPSRPGLPQLPVFDLMNKVRPLPLEDGTVLFFPALQKHHDNVLRFAVRLSEDLSCMTITRQDNAQFTPGVSEYSGPAIQQSQRLLNVFSGLDWEYFGIRKAPDDEFGQQQTVSYEDPSQGVVVQHFFDALGLSGTIIIYAKMPRKVTMIRFEGENRTKFMTLNGEQTTNIIHGDRQELVALFQGLSGGLPATSREKSTIILNAWAVFLRQFSIK